MNWWWWYLSHCCS